MSAVQEFGVADTPRYDRRSPLRWVVSHVLRYPALPLIFALTVLGMALSQSLGAVFVGQAFDAVAGGAGVAGLTAGALGVLAAWLVYGLCDVGNSWSIRFLAQRVERDAREELYLSLLGKSQSFHSRRQVGELMARATNDVQQLSLMLAPYAGLILEAIVTLVVPLAAIALLRAELLLVPLLYLLGFALTLRGYSAELRPLADGMRAAFGRLNGGLAESIAGVEVVHSFAQEPATAARFGRDARAYRDLFVREGAVQARFLPLLFYGLSLGLGLGHALVLLRDGALSVGQVIAFMGLLETLRFPTQISLVTVSQIQLGLAGAARIVELIDAPAELDENRGGHRAQMRGEIRLDAVGFSYAADAGQAAPAALSDVSLAVAPGQTLALVGQTGAGKTTLARLINRTFDATAGRVLVDGVDVRDWDLAALRSQIGIIEQDIFLFSRSVAENIAFGARGPADRAAIERAAQLAEADEFIRAMPAGYDTLVGERGVTLSGGQRQRIAIARALLSDPRILIIDDSTSALDSATEDRIQRALESVMRGRTTILITHRVSQIRRAHQVVLLKNGRVAEAGAGG